LGLGFPPTLLPILLPKKNFFNFYFREKAERRLLADLGYTTMLMVFASSLKFILLLVMSGEAAAASLLDNTK
jgi:hypothetical protein